MEIKIKIDAEGLEGAIHTLAQVLAGMDLPSINQTQPDVEVTKPTKTEEKFEEAMEKVAETTKEEAPPETPIKEDAPEEKKEATNTITLETVRVKLAELAQSGKQKEVKALITSLGAEKLSDIPAEKFQELLDKAADI